MSLAIYSSAAFSNASGLAVAAGAAVEVRRESDAALAAIFEDRAGATQITQPGFAADASGRFTFFAAGNETYRVTVDDGTESFTLRYQACGNAAERDVGVADGVASLDGSGAVEQEPASKGQPDGIAPLDGDGKVYGASPAELGYLAGVVSGIQAQIDVQIDALADRGAAAWIRFNMATDAIVASFNVSSITDEATGFDTIVWDTDFASADYAVVASGVETGVAINTVACDNYAASQCLILCRDLFNINTDGTLVSVIAFGAQA
jgi:hypothetical protein